MNQLEVGASSVSLFIFLMEALSAAKLFQMAMNVRSSL